MAEVADGLDPNENFEAALAQAAGVEAPEEQTADESTAISAGLTETPERPRDEDGRFAPAATESSETESEGGPDEGQPAEEEATNPALASLLEQHGGDPNAALEALIQERDNAQSLIGRQGNEVGELRSQLDELRGYVAALGEQSQQGTPPDIPTMNDEVVEGLEGLYEQQGARGMMGWVVENRPDLIEVAEQVWAAEDPVSAAGFRARREAFQVLGAQEEQAPAQPAIDPVLESMRAERALGNTIDTVRSELGISDEDWPSVRDELIPTLESDNTPSLIRNAAVSTDPEQQLEGMRNLMQIARSSASAKLASQASQQAAEQAVSRKQAATVLTGSLRPASPVEGQPGGEMSKEERKKAFHQALLATDVTSVADGLTGLK